MLIATFNYSYQVAECPLITTLQVRLSEK